MLHANTSFSSFALNCLSPSMTNFLRVFSEALMASFFHWEMLEDDSSCMCVCVCGYCGCLYTQAKVHVAINS